jgi:ATP-dependent protease ClpP protease subunit
MKAFAAAKKGPDELHLTIAGTIGEDWWAEEFVTAKNVRDALKEAGPVSLITVDLDSMGGSFFDGLSMYQALKDHPARVVINVGACAASSASLLAMSGDEIVMDETSTMLIHPVWSVTAGNADQHRKTADSLDLLSESAVTAYASRTGMSTDEVRSLMAEDRFMSAKEALELGFCTSIRKAKQKPKALSEHDARAELRTLRTKATASAVALRVAAMAPQKPHETPAPSDAPEATEKTQNMTQPAVFLAALCLAEGATDNDILTAINGLKSVDTSNKRLLEALSAKSTDEALGRIEALKTADERAKNAERELSEVRATEAKAKHEALINAAVDPHSSSPHAGKLTNAQKAWAQSVSTETLEGYLAVAPAITKGDGKREPSAKPNAYSGKGYHEMDDTERAELYAQDKPLFDQLRAEARAKGLL